MLFAAMACVSDFLVALITCIAASYLNADEPVLISILIMVISGLNFEDSIDTLMLKSLKGSRTQLIFQYLKFY